MGPGSVGTVGIPLGSTELGGAGLSPPSVALSPNPSVSGMMLTALPAITPPSPPPPVPTSRSTPACATTRTGVPTITGVPTSFGAFDRASLEPAGDPVLTNPEDADAMAIIGCNDNGYI